MAPSKTRKTSKAATPRRAKRDVSSGIAASQPDRVGSLRQVAAGLTAGERTRVARTFPARRLPDGSMSVSSRDVVATPEEKGFDQRWTHEAVLAAVFQGFTLGSGPRLAVYDPALGTGSAWMGVTSSIHLTGIEIDPEVAAVARAVNPAAEVTVGDFAAYRADGTFDLAGGGAPYRCQLLDRAGLYVSAAAEGFGPSHGFYLEQCIAAVRENGLVFAILPRNWHAQAQEKDVVDAVRKQAALVLRVELASMAATGGPVDLYVYSKASLLRPRCAVQWCTDLASLANDLRATLAKKEGESLAEALRAFSLTAVARTGVVSVPAVTLEVSTGTRDTQLPLTDTVEAMLTVNGGRVIVTPNGRQAAARIAQLDRASGPVYDAKRTLRTTRWRELLREPWEFVADQVVASLRAAGVTPVLGADQQARLARRARWAEVQLTPFEQWVKDANGRWVEEFAETGLRARFPERYQANMAKARALGLADVLYPYQVDDIARMAMKTRFELGSDVGIGKSIEYIGYVLVRDLKKAGVLCNSRLLGKWADEFEKWQARLPHLDLSYTVVECLSDMGDVVDGVLTNRRKLDGVRFVLFSYESLWRIPQDSVHRGHSQTTTRRIAVKGKRKGDPVSWVARDYWHPAKYSLANAMKDVFANGALMADEAYRLKDDTAKQTAALYLLKARCRIACCATMIRNYVGDLLPILNWLFGDRGLLFRRYGIWTQGEIEAFVERLGTFVYYEYDDASRSDSKKMLPKIARADEFRQWHAPMQIRRSRDEPHVRPFVGSAKPSMQRESIPMTPAHRAYYETLQNEFRIWWDEYLAAQRAEGRDINPSMLLSKLRVLHMASTCPSMASLSIRGAATAKYTGGQTAKVARAVELVRDHAARGEKVVVFAQFKEAIAELERGMADFNPTVITGDVSLHRAKRTRRSKRDAVLAAFRTDPTRMVLLASQKCLSEGYDIPEASVAIFVDCDWTPSVDMQALGRLRRPQQTRPITCYVLSMSGTVDEYVALLSGAKACAHAEVLDGEAYELALEMIPDVQDYANGIRDKLTLDDIRPSRRISRIELGDVEIFNAAADGPIADAMHLGRILTVSNKRFANLLVA